MCKQMTLCCAVVVMFGLPATARETPGIQHVGPFARFAIGFGLPVWAGWPSTCLSAIFQ
jgi:formyltetrahydrofolate synthetase